MNILKSFLSPGPSPAQLLTTSIRGVLQAIKKKPEAAAAPAKPDAKKSSPTDPKKLVPFEKKIWPWPVTRQPAGRWIPPRGIPRISIFSPRPTAWHNWQNWLMLRDVKRRAYVNLFYRWRYRLQAVLRTNILPVEVREDARREIWKLPRDCTIRRVNDRCVLTSRGRGVQYKWHMSRMMARHFMDYNLMSGTLRAKWGNRFNPVYWHHLDPDLHGTLREVDPMQGKHVDWTYWKKENSFTGNNEVMRTRKVVYNQGVYKKPFVYPPPQRL